MQEHDQAGRPDRRRRRWLDLRGLRPVAVHAVAFARYWNRPMDDWRNDFLLQFCGLLVLCGLGAPWAYIGGGFFSILVARWTWRTISGYRRGERAGSRWQHHDRNDIWRDGPNG